MSAELVSDGVATVLADGTVCYAPVGEVVFDGPLVICHLCGRSFRSVAAHLRAHGWTKQRYCITFGLELSQSLEGHETRKLRAAALTARLLFDPAMREGSAAGRARAKSGELAKDAAAAARGRPFPEQRRRKSSQVRTPSAVVAKANRDRADRRLADVAAAVASRHGYPDLGAYVAARRGSGLSLAAISREAGLHKDWLSRHLRRVDPAAARAGEREPAGGGSGGAAGAGVSAGAGGAASAASGAVEGAVAGAGSGWAVGARAGGAAGAVAGAGVGTGAGGAVGAASGGAAGAAVGTGSALALALTGAVARLGYQDPAAYLRERHHDQHRTVNAIAADLGVSRRAVVSALRRYGLGPVAHAAKRHLADQRAAEVAARLGFGSVADYVAERRAVGLTWRAIAAESGQPQSWLRRHAPIQPT